MEVAESPDEETKKHPRPGILQEALTAVAIINSLHMGRLEVQLGANRDANAPAPQLGKSRGPLA